MNGIDRVRALLEQIVDDALRREQTKILTDAAALDVIDIDTLDDVFDHGREQCRVAIEAFLKRLERDGVQS